jgi:hypothetical protein
VGLLKTATRAAVASSVHGRVQRRQQARWAQQEAHTQAMAPQPPTPPPPSVTPQAPSPARGAADTQHQLELLEQLGQLRDAGVLTDAEFAAKKAEILAS